jgi:hypothetical protein
MTASKAIQKHCIDCIGGSAQDVPLCQILDCPLWPFRLGCGMSSRVYERRVKSAWERGGEAVEELRGMGLDMASLLKNGMPAYQSRKKSAENGLRPRGAAQIPAARSESGGRPC